MRSPRSKPILELATVDEYGVRFATSLPVSFNYIRNTEKSPWFGSTYGQDIEPAGRYILHNPNLDDLPRHWESGVAEFRCPLVIPLSRDPDQIYGPTGWKAILSHQFKAKGKNLTRKLQQAGYDGIVTVMDGSTREIVDISMSL